MVNCLREEVSPFGIQCCIVTPGLYCTNIFARANIKIGAASIPDYAELNENLQAGITARAGPSNPWGGDPRKATDRVVDMVRSEGKAAGRSIPDRFPVGAMAVTMIKELCAKKIDICNEWGDMTSDTQFDVED